MPGGNMLYIPTNRSCAPVIEQSLREVQWAATATGRPFSLVVVEHGASVQESTDHRQVLGELASEAPGKVLHITRYVAEQYVEALLSRCRLPAGEAHALRRCLLPAGLSYGAAPNLAYLIACTLGCDTIHRRDSDVYLDALAPGLPIELEVALLGRQLADSPVPVDDPGPDPPVEIDRPVKLIGTSAFGRAAFDRRDLFEAGFEFGVALQALGRPGTPLDDVRSQAQFFLVEEARMRYIADFVQIDVDGRVEMQACAIVDGFRLVPEMPACDIVGSDYMVKDILWQLGDPVVFHSRKLEHRYDEGRESQLDTSAQVAYALRDIRYLQMGRVWAAHNRNLESFVGSLGKSEGFDPSGYAASFRRATGDAVGEIAAVRVGSVEVYRAASRAASGPLVDRLERVAAAIEARGADLDDDIRAAVEEFTFLVERWADLIAAAASLDLDDGRLGAVIQPGR